MSLSFADHMAELEREGALFAAAIPRAGPDAPIPTCPGWTMRDLVLHLGEVHRWAHAVLTDGASAPRHDDDPVGPLPGNESLVDWLLAGHANLLNALRAADPDVKYFTFLADPAPPLQFWARRQAHETGMHRVDAESASGAITPFATKFAADGVDEMVTGFVPRKHTRLHTETPTTLQLRSPDAGAAWQITISTEQPFTERLPTGSPATADCVVTAAASHLYPALWNRRGVADLHIDGDAAVLDTFRENVRIRWS